MAFAIGRRVAQARAEVVFSVAQPLAVLPTLPIVSRLLPRLRAKSGYPQGSGFECRVVQGVDLSVDWRPRKCTGERYRNERDNLLFMMALATSINDNDGS